MTLYEQFIGKFPSAAPGIKSRYGGGDEDEYSRHVAKMRKDISFAWLEPNIWQVLQELLAFDPRIRLTVKEMMALDYDHQAIFELRK